MKGWTHVGVESENHKISRVGRVPNGLITGIAAADLEHKFKFD